MKIRLIALLMALCCAVTLFGCEAEEEESIRRKRKSSNKETTEEYTEATGEVIFEDVTEERITETTAPVDPPKSGYAPGSYFMPAIELMDLTYLELTELPWNKQKTQDGERWILQAESCDSTFIIVFDGDFQDPYTKPSVINIEDSTGKGYAYVTEDIQLGDRAEWMNSIKDQIGPMDGGLYASVTLDGCAMDLLFDGEMDKLDEAKLYFAQIRRWE